MTLQPSAHFLQPAAPTPSPGRVTVGTVAGDAPMSRGDGPWVGAQRWERLLFAHWTVPAAQVQATLPPGLAVDTFAGEAYLGLVPFFMQRVRPRGLPPLPGLSWFLEFNVRTYVRDRQGRPGVWFYSLDCNQPVAVALARRVFHLRYEHARMDSTVTGNTCDFTSRRRGAPAGDRFTWSQPRQGGRLAAPGSLDYFLVERYRLFTARPDGQLLTGGVSHAPYRVHAPDVTRYSTAAAALAGFDLKGPPVSLLAADPVDVAIHPLRDVTSPVLP